MAWNQSRIKMFRRCQKQYSFRYDTADKFGLEPSQEMVRKVHKAPLYRGTWLHALLEAHHMEWAGIPIEFETEDGEAYTGNWETVHEMFVDQYDALFDEEKEALGNLPDECYRLFRGYLRFWAEKDKDRYEVALLKDGKPAIEFLVQRRLERWGVSQPFKGRLDLMVVDHEMGGLWLWDHKWVGKVPDSDERMMSPQNVMYVWALRKMGYDLRGFVYNYGRTKPPAIPRQLKRSGLLSMAQKMDTDYYTYLARIKEVHGSDWKRAAKTIYRDKLLQLKGREALWYRREPIPVESHKISEGLAEFLVSIKDIERRNKNHVPRTYTYSCKWGCEYHDLCVAEFAGLDIEPIIDADFTFEDERYTEPDPDLLKD